MKKSGFWVWEPWHFYDIGWVVNTLRPHRSNFLPLRLGTRCATISTAFARVPAPWALLGLSPLSVTAASCSHVPLPPNPCPPACTLIPTTAALRSVLIYSFSFPAFTSFTLPKIHLTRLPIESTGLEGLRWRHRRSNHLNDSMTRSAGLVSQRISHWLCLLTPGFASISLDFSYHDFSLFLDFNFLRMFKAVPFLLPTPHKF